MRPVRSSHRPSRAGHLAHAVITTLTASVAAALLLVGSARPAMAHDELVAVTPGDGASVTALPELVLEFSAELTTSLEGANVVELVDADGAVRASGGEAAGTVLRLAVPAEVASTLENGAYTIRYRVVSSDGHPITGSTTFAFQPAPPPPPPPTTETPPVTTGAGDDGPQPTTATSGPGASTVPTTVPTTGGDETATSASPDDGEPGTDATDSGSTDGAGSTDDADGGGVSTGVVLVTLLVLALVGTALVLAARRLRR